MFSFRIRSICPFSCFVAPNDQDIAENEVIPWSRDLETHCFGEFSFAVHNNEGFDCSQLESGLGAVFIGVYPGKWGQLGSLYSADNLFPLLLEASARADHVMNEQIIREAMFRVQNTIGKGLETRVGGCLTGIIWETHLYVSHSGGGKAVIGWEKSDSKGYEVTTNRDQMSRFNPEIQYVRLEPYHRFIIFGSDGLWNSLSTQEALVIVHGNPKEGIAARLIRAAVRNAKVKTFRGIVTQIMTRDEDKKTEDITALVVYINYEMLQARKDICNGICINGSASAARGTNSKFGPWCGKAVKDSSGGGGASSSTTTIGGGVVDH